MSTEQDLKFPQIKADILKCREYIETLVEAIWNPKAQRKRVMWNIPPRSEDWDVQFAALIDEVEYYRMLEDSLQRSNEKFV